ILHQLLAENGLNGRVKTILESNKRIYSQCEYACRMLKESFFSNEEQYRRSNGKVKAAIVEIDDENLLRPQATPALIDAALAEPQASLDGRGWKEAFLVTLQDVRRECEKFGKPPETIALTGGGARMKFVKEACECVFPDALVLIDATPELSIAKGLARAGRWDIRATRFRDEIEPLCERIPGAFKQEGPQFLSEVVPRLSDSFVSDVMRAGLKDWRAGRVKTLNGIEKHIAELGDRWARSDSVKQIVANATANWTKRAVAQLWPSVTEVAMKYEISAESLSVSAKSDKAIAVSVKGPNLDQDTSPFAWIAGAVAGAISAKIAVVVVPVVMAVLLKATIITAAMTGPVGWAIAGVIVLAGTFFGKEAAQDMVKDMDIYVWIREKLLSDAKLDAACIKAKDEVEEKLRSELEVALKATLVAKASAELKRDLTERMENAIVLIR
ncbi:MAG TPA: hypothetical protein VGE52_11955, partial [Pirellulales bacterium]